MRPRRSARSIVLALGVLTAACGSEPNTGPIVDPAVEPFVGTWDARVFTVTADADTSIVADLLEDGSFVVNIQASGTYTATLVFGPLNPVVEIGQMTVSGGFVTLRPNQTAPCDPSPQPYDFVREDYLELGPGPTCFDFNLDGEADPAQAYLELELR